MNNKEVETVTISDGKVLLASDVVCPVCRVLDLSTDINTSQNPFVLTCSAGHQWTITPL